MAGKGKEEVSELKLLLTEKDNQLRNFSFQLEEKNKQLAKVQEENALKTTKINSQEEKIAILLREDSVLRETTKNFETSLMTLREQLQIMKQEKNKLTEQLLLSSSSSPSNSPSSSSSSSSPSSSAELEKELEKLRREREEWEREKSRMEEEMRRMGGEIGRMEGEMSEQANFWNERAKNQKIRFIEVQKRSEEMEGKYKQAEIILRDLDDEIVKLKRGNANMQEELSFSKTNRDELLSLISDKDSQIKLLSDETSQLKTQIEQDKKDLSNRILHEQNINKKLLNQHVEESNQKQGILRKEISILQSQLSDLEQSIADERIQLTKMTEKSSDLELALSEKISEISRLNDSLLQLRSDIDDRNKQLQIEKQKGETLKQENEEIKQSLSLLSHKYSNVEIELNAMSIRKEEIVTRHQTAIDDVRKEYSKAAEILQSQLADLTSKYDDASSSSSYYKSFFDSHSSEIKSLKDQIKEYIDQITDLTTQRDQLLSSSSQLEIELQERKAEISEKDQRIESLSTSLSDLDTQLKIESKKSQRLVKDLQAQLQKARSQSSSDHNLHRSFSAQVGGGEMKNNSNNNLQRKLSVQNVSTPPNNNEEVNISSQDLEVLAEKIAELQQKNFVLDESNKGLQGQIDELKNDLANKTQIFQHFVINDLQIQGRSTQDMDKYKLQRAKEGGIMGRFFGGKEIGAETVQSEINSKLTAVMEETILKNLQLQNDIKILGDEISRLADENLNLITIVQNHNLPLK